MAIADDISVAANGDIRWVGASTTYTVLELHRFLQDLADDEEFTGNDILDITGNTPSDRSTDNIITLLNNFNIDDTLAEHLYDGSITQTDGDEQYSGLVVVGSVNDATTELQIIQNNAILSQYWGTGLNDVAASNILLRVLVKTRTGGSDIDGKRVRIQARFLGDTYAEFAATLGLGNSTAAIFTNGDLNNTTASGSIAGWASITNVEGYQTIDLNNGAGAQPYYSQWNRGSQTINELYERTKWIQRSGSAQSIHSMNGQLFRGVTHNFTYDTEVGSGFTEDENLIFDTGASASLLALDDFGTEGNIYIQLLTGATPVDDTGFTGSASSTTGVVKGAVTSRTISPTFIGSSTGTAIIGAYGIGIESADLTNSDLLTDLSGSAQTPPNNVTFTVSSMVATEDRCLVGPRDTGVLGVNQLSSSSENTASDATFVIVETIPSDTPVAGTIRAFNGSSYDRIEYSSYAASTFTLSGSTTLANTYDLDSPVFISYIDELVTGTSTSASFTAVYSTDRDLFVRVRDGGGTPIKTFETPATFGNANATVAAIRTTDL